MKTLMKITAWMFFCSISFTAIQAQTTSSRGFITFDNFNGHNVIIEIYKENGTQNPDFIGTINPDSSKKISCNLDDVFSFKPKAIDFEILPFTVKRFDITHKIIIGKRFENRNPSTHRIPNADASRHSFDIFHIDPIFLDYEKSRQIKNSRNEIIGSGGGMRKQIFKRLDERDVDWTTYDGNIALKNQFGLKVLVELEKEDETKMYYSAKSFQQSFSANIGVSAGKEEAVKAAGSASFGYNSEENSSQRQIYTYGRAQAIMYEVDLKMKYIDLTDEFKNAIKDLKKSNAYNDFIKNWGTHYPTHTDYGGIQMEVRTFSEEQFMESSGWNLNVKEEVAIKGVKAERGGGYETSKSYEEMTSKSKNISRSKGGLGSGDGWSVTMDNSQAVGIKLERLNKLVYSDYFKDESTEADLTPIREKLEKAITDYIGSKEDSGTSLKPRFFEISDVQWKMIKEKDGHTTPDIFGNVWIGVLKKDKNKHIPEAESLHLPLIELGVFKTKHEIQKSVWNEYAPGVEAEKGHIEKCEESGGNIVFSIPAERDGNTMKVNPDNYSFIIQSTLKDYDKTFSNQVIGEKMITVRNCKNIGTGKETITIKMRSDDGDIDVSATVREIEMGFDEK